MPEKPTREDLLQLLLGKIKQAEDRDIVLTNQDARHLLHLLHRPFKVSQVCKDFLEQGCHDCDDLACGDNITLCGKMLRDIRRNLLACDRDEMTPAMAIRNIDRLISEATHRERIITRRE